MPMPINTLSIQPGPPIYYTDKWQQVLEDHLDYLINHESTTTVSIEPQYAYKYQYDFIGLLNYMNMPAHLHWTLMRINGMYRMEDFTSDRTLLIVPDSSELERIKKLLTTSYN
jgi:hypothetical protein